ncbi:substrate-binding domain-containing protein [Shewanella japonica]|uniref:Periplasmic binding protein domain-containing protein n=1 Tax=Shewanella japonica TaxID=93973 RepID=A0ABN4YNC9_9GAMM|nr:substrate-binding domain-containing protein [Shewanella japonica]ARD24052.1 hypothetical protein SJ2017_3818 [Shewanella japonica]
MRALLIFMLLMLSNSVLASTNVVFLNPGAADDSFWRHIDNVMQVTAQDQDFNLTVLHSNRDRNLMLNQAVEISNHASLPDYLVMVNDKDVAKKVLDTFYQKPVHIIFMINDIEQPLRLQLMNDPHWKKYLLPAVIEDNYHIGRESAAALTQLFTTTPAHVVAVAGDDVRETSLLRTQGMEGYFNLHLNTVLELVVYADWQANKAYEQTHILLNRFPGVDGLWIGNDEMAVGVVKALKETHRKPGEDIKVLAINPSVLSYELLKNGDVNAIGGGSFLLAGVVGLNIARHQQKQTFDLCLEHNFYRHLTLECPLFRMIVNNQWHQILEQEVKAVCSVN